MTEEKTQMIHLKKGVEITYKCKRYVNEIPEKIFKEMYEKLGKDEKDSENLYKEKLKKFKFVPKKNEVEPVKK